MHIAVVVMMVVVMLERLRHAQFPVLSGEG